MLPLQFPVLCLVLIACAGFLVAVTINVSRHELAHYDTTASSHAGEVTLVELASLD